MTTEETELTFIRCPGCRSLVPAVAARCRMCGELLESQKSGKEQGADSVSKKSRVRQRTMSVSGDEVQTLKEQVVDSTLAEESTIDNVGVSNVDDVAPHAGEKPIVSFETPDPFDAGKEFLEAQGPYSPIEDKPMFAPREESSSIADDFALRARDVDERDERDVGSLGSQPEAPSKKRRRRRRKKKQADDGTLAQVEEGADEQRSMNEEEEMAQ